MCLRPGGGPGFGRGECPQGPASPSPRHRPRLPGWAPARLRPGSRRAAIEASGRGIGWTDGEQGIGPAYLFTDPDGHEFGIYWETEWYVPPEGQRPALKNQAAPFPGRGANVELRVTLDSDNMHEA